MLEQSGEEPDRKPAATTGAELSEQTEKRPLDCVTVPL
ncbi:hypothetical protein HALLA_02925 (plasmid) [Halostagnicola larsenii XH-48]|uniref:Uncharacterized protein n=1 Tax=Halostagnicola larsenii XH-48 TaxID=797299 RepID=W0JWC4_9EURY|nr:hypothetical protein HALLA_02925 [Halostagnicola larsenii XH-48]